MRTVKPSLVLAVLAALVATSACSGDDQPDEQPAQTSSTRAGFDIACPEVSPEKQQYTPFRPVEKGAPKLIADLGIYALGDRNFCVVPESYDSPAVAAKIVSYDVLLDDRDNYGEKYGTFSRGPSDELLNFPFDFHVYNQCRAVTGTIVVRADGQKFSYVAKAHAGPKCEDA